jgi:hypothetical protein
MTVESEFYAKMHILDVSSYDAIIYIDGSEETPLLYTITNEAERWVLPHLMEDQTLNPERMYHLTIDPSSFLHLWDSKLTLGVMGPSGEISRVTQHMLQ